jgi:hypothetical protein
VPAVIPPDADPTAFDGLASGRLGSPLRRGVRDSQRGRRNPGPEQAEES